MRLRTTHAVFFMKTIAAGAIAFTIFNAEGSAASAGHTFGYVALVVELIAYAAQMTYLPRVSKRYKPITLTALYYMVATVASAITLLVRDRDQLEQVMLLRAVPAVCIWRNPLQLVIPD